MTERFTGETAEDTDMLSVEELVDVIAYTGPGASNRVRVYYPSGKSKVGRTVWSSEFAMKSPAVVFDDPERLGSYKAVLPLGGNTIYIHPPKVSSLGPDRSSGRAAILEGYSVTTLKRPYDEAAMQCRFEILPSEDV